MGTCPANLGHGGSWDLLRFEEFFGWGNCKAIKRIALFNYTAREMRLSAADCVCIFTPDFHRALPVPLDPLGDFRLPRPFVPSLLPNPGYAITPLQNLAYATVVNAMFAISQSVA